MKRLLLVEDNYGDARLAQEMLSESPDFEVEVTCIGRLAQAVTALESHHFDVVLLDLTLPDSSGLEGLHRLQALSKEVPIIVLSGLNDKALAFDALKHGAQDYLLKGTMNAEALTRVIQYSIERRASDARYRLLVANLPGVVYSCRSDLHWTLVFASGQFEALTGFAVEEFRAGSSSRFSDLIHPDDIERTTRLVLGAVTCKQPYSVEYRIRRKDGAIRWVLDRGQSVGSANGALPHRDGVLFDITEQQAMEAKIQKTEQQLRQARQFAAMGNLAVGVAHDFNNLITAINGFADLVIKELVPDTRSHTHMLQIRKAAQRAMAISQHLLALGQASPQDLTLVDMNLLIADMERMIRLVIGARRRVETIPEPLLGRVKGNPRELEQALLILAMNVVEGRSADEHLRIETRIWDVSGEDAESFGFVRRGAYVAVAMRSESQPTEISGVPCLIVPESDSANESGFGMATVLKIMMRHQGYLFVTRDDAGMCEYTLVLPFVHIDNNALLFTNSVPPAPRSGTETVLVVDDEDTVRTLICELLGANGYRVLEASSGEQALQVSERHKDRIDLLITDEIMPGLSGHELVALMAARYPQLCVLPMSTSRPEAVFERVPFLLKPFTTEMLLKGVGEALQDGGVKLYAHADLST